MIRSMIPLLLVACTSTSPFSGSLDTPGPLAVLPAGAGPFDATVAYVADRHGGRIRALDVHKGSYLADDPYASFLRGDGIGTGYNRLLSDVVAYAPDADHAFVFATDRRYQQLLVAPHVIGRGADGFGVEATATVTDTTPAGAAASFSAASVVTGISATESWVFRGTGTGWRATGSRSGTLPVEVAPGRVWNAPDHGLSVMIHGDTSVGTDLSLEVNSGLTEIDLPGTPMSIELSPDRSRLALTVTTETGASLYLLDPAAPALNEPVLTATSLTALAWLENGAALLVADPDDRRMYELPVAAGVVGAPIPHELPAAVVDIDALVSDTTTRVFLASGEAPELWVLDLAADRLIDLNPATAAVDPMRFDSPIAGVAASTVPVVRPRYDANGDQVTGRAVAVSLSSGRLVWMQEEDGCLVPDNLGPRTLALSDVLATDHPDYLASFTLSAGQTTSLLPTEDKNHHVVINSCAGVAREQTWVARYQEVEQAWELTGQVSGVQQRLAYEDQRYLSDDAEISFVMRSGFQPSADGWTVTFQVAPGALTTDGSNGSTTTRLIKMFLPGDPVVAPVLEAGVWIPYVLVSATGTDVVLRADPRDGFVDRYWD